MYLTLGCILLVAVELWEIGRYYSWYLRARKKAALDGTFVKTRGRGKPYLILISACFAMLLLTLVSQRPGALKYLPVFLAGYLGLVMGLRWFLRYAKRMDVVKDDSRFYMVVLVGLGFVILIMLFNSAAGAMRMPVPASQGESYQYEGEYWMRGTEPVPLHISELTGDVPENYSTRSSVQESVFLKSTGASVEAIQTVEKGKDMSYQVLRVKLPGLYDFCLDLLLQKYQDPRKIELYGNTYAGDFRAMAPAPWGAEQAYQLYRMDKPRNEYILCFDGILIHLTMNWEPTPEQMAVAGSTLTSEQNFENLENN